MSVSTFEIIAGPAEIYVAPVGEPFPAVDAVPAGNWVRLGRTKGGVTGQYNQTQKEIRADQDRAPVKVIPTGEKLTISFSLAILTVDVVNTPPGRRMAMLMRGPFAEREVPVVVYSGNPQEWQVMSDPAAATPAERFGRLRGAPL